MTPLIRLDVQDIGFAEPALARSVDAFLGKGGGRGLSPGGAGAAITGGASADATLDDVNFRIRDLHEISAGLMVTVYQSDTRTFGLRLLAGRGRAEVYLPDGVDIFVDTITVTAKTRFAETAVVIEQALPWPALLSDRLAVTAETGHRHTRSHVALRSALIRRDDTGTDNQSFAGIARAHRAWAATGHAA
ncbi:hypothetical protein ABIE58_003054 [Roseovarius sp. MBR-78]|jgi:hypothetical protein|uniref:hypothetical protein n=1 Tax=Roseovarius sp. MBR-78 TaxID=3156460 RepID=UPI003391A4F5